MNTNSYKDTTLNPNILPLLKHQLPRQELNESYTKKKCQYQPKSSCSITSNHSFKFNQDYNKNKLDDVIEHSTIQQINNKLKCHYIQNKLDTIHNPINNNFENKINDILKPITSSNEINQIVHCSNLLKKNNYLSSSLSSSSSSSSSGSSSILTLPHLSPLPIKSLYDNEKLYLKQNSIRKHFQKLTNSIFNYNYTSNPIYSNSYYSVNNDKPLDLRNPLQIHLNTVLYKNYNNNSNNNNNSNDKLFTEIEKLGKSYLSMGNFNSNEIWSTIFTLLNRKLNQFSQINQSKFHLNSFKLIYMVNCFI
ncbi:unnamed protein product [Schistosoma curassoni]|uniref:RUN domain-containing protein n=1 Tax=Schistosoma curassoni TaxID=6186 RepID=A0A183JTK0_9TREM|nr:unnamed protein product [Schistosoma curassoni]